MPRTADTGKPLQSKPYQITRGAERLRSDPLNLMRVMPPKGGFRFSTLSVFPLLRTDRIPQGLTPCAKFSHTAANGYKQVPASAA